MVCGVVPRSNDHDLPLLHSGNRVLASVIATIIGTMAALGIHNSRDGRKLIMNITYIPVLNPDIVTAISLMILFVFAKVRLA